MNGADIKPGSRYGFRRQQPDPLEQVRVVEKVRPGRCMVEFVGPPHPGLVDYVRSRDLICKWTDREALLRNERRLSRLRDQVLGNWPGEGPYDTAVMYVLDATGEEVGTVRGVLSARPEVFERLWARIDKEAPVGGASFVDRIGQMQCGWSAAEVFSRQFAQAEPKVVLDTIELQERRLSAGGREARRVLATRSPTDAGPGLRPDSAVGRR